MNLKEYERVEAAINSLTPTMKDCIITTECILNRPPMLFDATMEETYDIAHKIAQAEGIEIIVDGSGSASDANFVAQVGTPVLDGLGVIGEGFHSDDEYFLLDSLTERTKLAAALIRNW